MIELKANGEYYKINKDLSVSEGKYRDIIVDLIEIIKLNYNVSDGFFEPYLYIKLSCFKWIELISFNWSNPKKINTIY